MSIDWAALRAPFPADDVEWRVQRSGMRDGKPWAQVLAYITNRAIQQRFDDVCGPANWRNSFRTGPDGGIICTLYVRVGDEWVGKEDGAANTDVEAIKGGLSGAMKRAAVQFGVGRYLYRLGTSWANFHDKGQHRDKVKDKQSGKEGWFRWDPPQLPAWALPEGMSPREAPKQNATPKRDPLPVAAEDAKAKPPTNRERAPGPQASSSNVKTFAAKYDSKKPCELCGFPPAKGDEVMWGKVKGQLNHAHCGLQSAPLPVAEDEPPPASPEWDDPDNELPFARRLHPTADNAAHQPGGAACKL